MSSCSACDTPLPSSATACPACGTSVSAPAPFLAGSDDPWGARPPAPTIAAPPPLPAAGAPSAPTPSKGGFPTWAKVAIGIAIGLIVLGSIGAFLAVRAFRSLESAGVDFVQGGDAPVTGDAAVDGTVVGDCVASGSTSSCSSPHELEVFHVVPTSGSAYPTFDRLFDVSDGECVTAFEQYVGIDYYESEFWLDAYAPSESAWNAGDQSIRCAAYDPLGDMTESVRGIGR